MQINLSVIGRSQRTHQKIFLLIIGLSLAGYITLRQWFPLAPFYKQLPLLDIRTFTPSLPSGLLYGLLFLMMYGLYLLAYVLIQQLRLRPKIWLIMGTAVLFSLPLLQTYPINSTDIFRYLIHGRITSIYGANTYTTPPSAFPEDPYFGFNGEWAAETSPYGPLWELLMAGVTAVTPGQWYEALLILKLLGLAAFLGSGLLIWQILAQARQGRRLEFTLLWLWNPALLLTFVVDAHNDALMIFWFVLAVFLGKRGRPTAAFLVLMLAILTKPVALLAVPFFFIFCWRGLADNQARLRFLLATAVATVCLFAVSFYPFGSPLPLMLRLLREAANYPGFSPVALVLLGIQEQGGHLMQRHLDWLALCGRLFLVGLLGWLVWRTWHGRSPWRSIADIFYGYIVQAFAFRIWYATWSFPWLLLAAAEQKGNGRLPYCLRFGLCFLLTTQLSVIIYGHLHVYRFNFENYATHLIGVPFTFLLPLLLAASPEIYQHLRSKLLVQ